MDLGGELEAEKKRGPWLKDEEGVVRSKLISGKVGVWGRRAEK